MSLTMSVMQKWFVSDEIKTDLKLASSSQPSTSLPDLLMTLFKQLIVNAVKALLRFQNIASHQ